MLPKQDKVFQNIFNYFLSGVAFVGAFLIFPFKFFSILYLKVRRGIFLVSSKYKQEGFTDNICFWPGTIKIFLRVNLEYLSYITLRLILKINLSLENVKTQTKCILSPVYKCFKLFHPVLKPLHRSLMLAIQIVTWIIQIIVETLSIQWNKALNWFKLYLFNHSSSSLRKCLCATRD